MDRRNGGDPLAPPRPPKLLPRVHRPRALEPPMMSAPPTPVQQQQPQQQIRIINNNNNSSSSSSSSSISKSNSTNSSNNRLNHTLANSRNSNNNSSTSSSSSSTSSTTHLTTPLLHLHQSQHQQQHPHSTTTSLNRNNSNLSSASSTSSVATTVSSVNSFTRRRPPPLPVVGTAATATASSSPILPLLGASLNLNFINNNSIEPVPVSPVTLAAPRPESERLTNEYVDTPFRTAQQLQQASRNQHPAGQHIHGQTTTQHNLLLLQHSQRQQQQQHNQQHHSSHHQSSGSHSNAGSGGILGVGTTIGGVSAGTIHSNSRSLKCDGTGGPGPAIGTTGDGAPQTTQTTTTSATLATSPLTNTRLQQQQQHHRPNALPITQPITKQPAPATFKKDLSGSIFHEEPLDLHHIGGTASSGGTGTGSLGTPIGAIILGDGGLNPITCPRCDRCRCEQCQSPRQLPQTWVCNKTCLCSAETIIDYASCLCCVKALFYHCAKDQEMECDDGDTTLCVDDPCSCLPHKRTQRWGWLGALSLVLPCLWCYWPMRGCVAICEKCYARHAGQGCRCQTIGSTSSMLPIVNIGGGTIGGANASNGGTKSSGVSGGVHSGISGSGNGHHHHHHHGSNSGGGGGNTGESSAARILRKCDITPEKRLLDSSPEY